MTWAQKVRSRFDAGCAVVAIALVLMAAVPVLLALRFLGDAIGYDITRACDAEDPFLRPRAVVAGRTVEIAGTTNLPEGARIWVSYWQRSYPTHDDSTTVRDGRFAFTSDLSDHPAGTVTAELEFSIGWRSPDQPAEIAERYGGASAQCLWGAEQAVSDSGDPPEAPRARHVRASGHLRRHRAGPALARPGCGASADPAVPGPGPAPRPAAADRCA